MLPADAAVVISNHRVLEPLAKKAGLGRESLYKALAPGAQPRYDTIFRVAQALGVSFHFSASERPAPRKASRSTAGRAAAPAAVKKPSAQARRGEPRTAAKP